MQACDATTDVMRGSLSSAPLSSVASDARHRIFLWIGGFRGVQDIACKHTMLAIGFSSRKSHAIRPSSCSFRQACDVTGHEVVHAMLAWDIGLGDLNANRPQLVIPRGLPRGAD